MMKNKKVIITGVTGQDGSLMADYLLKNTEVTIIGAVRRLSVKNHQGPVGRCPITIWKPTAQPFFTN